MWEVHRKATWLIALFGMLTCYCAGTEAQTQNSFFSNQSVSNGYLLPHVPVPNSFDEVRAADGTSCRTSMAGNGSYLDIGSIGNKGVNSDFDSGSVYARVIVPLGERPQRIDCSQLYYHEIERLRYELRLAKSGIGEDAGTASINGQDPSWARDGWTTENRNKEIGEAELPPSDMQRLGAPKVRKPRFRAPLQSREGPQRRVRRAGAPSRDGHPVGHWTPVVVVDK